MNATLIEKLPPNTRARLLAALRLKARGYRSNRYIQAVSPSVYPKQAAFLASDKLELMFGGAASGGKSQALLLGALQYVDIPGYSAILFRRTITDLALPGSLMHRAREWMSDFPDVRWNGTERAFYFPEGGQLTFGYLQDEGDTERYKSAEFQFVGFDELTEHPEANYRYLFSRLRRLKGMPVPIRMRSATNPGGQYGTWVRERFIPDEYVAASPAERFSREWARSVPCEDCQSTGSLGLEPCPYCDGHGAVTRHFLPARGEDNLAMDRDEYLKSLREQTFVNRARLEFGDWDIMEEGNLFRQSWFRYFTRVGDHFVIYPPDQPHQVISAERIIHFVTADTASKAATHNDPTVICRWAYDTREHHLFLLGVLREWMEIPRIAPAIINAATQCNARFVLIEDANSGTGVIQTLRGAAGRGITIQSYSPHSGDKVSRSTEAQIRVEAGQVHFPRGEDKGVQEFLSELVQFPGGQHDDCVDNLSMACWHVGNQYRVSAPAWGGPCRLPVDHSEIGFCDEQAEKQCVGMDRPHVRQLGDAAGTESHDSVGTS